RCYPIDDDDDR
ncbi:Bcl-2-like protein, partial [Monkeypox virus]